MIAAYIREGIEGRELELQKEAIQNWLLTESIDEGSVTWYEDRQGDRKSSRSAFETLSQDICAGKITTVLVWKLDRLSKSIRDGVSLLSEWCANGVRIVSVSQHLDIQGNEASVVRLVSALQEIEVVVGEERRLANIVMAANKEAAKQRRLEAVRKQKEAVLELYNSGLSISEIAERLGISTDTVSNYLIIY